MKRVQDLKEKESYAWYYMGNRCVGVVTQKAAGVTRCHYAVGMWDDSESAEEREADHLAFDVNLRDYDIDGFEIASGEERRRYDRVINAYNENIELANAAYAEDVKSDKEELFSPLVKKLGLTVVGHIDLDDKKHRLEALGATMKIDRDGLVNLHMSHSGHKYSDSEIIRFKTSDREGMAVGLVNKYTGEAGYYVAMGIDGPGTVSKYGETLSDGTIAGMWPAGTNISMPNKMEIVMGQQFLLNSHSDFINALMEKHKRDYEAEQERIRREEAERIAREKAEAEEAERRKQEAAKQEAEKQSAADEEHECQIFANIELSHIPYVRGQETLMDMKWPSLCDSIRPHQAFFVLSEFAKIVETCYINQKSTPEGSRTYILTRPYLKEIRRRQREYLENNEYSFAKLLGADAQRCGTIVYRTGTELDKLSTLIYNVDVHKNGRETVRFALLTDMELQCTYRGSTQGFFGDTTPIIAYGTSNSPRNLKQMVEAAKKFILAFLAMEEDTSNIIHKYTSGNGSAHKVYEKSHLTEADDIEIRNSSWFTNIFVNKTIAVDSYKSHRWMGSGDNKHLEEVQVSAYTKNGYTMPAKVTK